jgi:gamma-glutamyltranspeptidase
MAPAISFATEGFPLEAALRFAIDRQQATMKKFPDLARVFLPKDQVPAESELIRQPELGE